ncbi:MAG TPA: hypothetical protein VMB26_00010 [Candidatus Binataceae bacterium]|nr:hypothetical protein [Candidatus Binataceae bacterium]
MSRPALYRGKALQSLLALVVVALLGSGARAEGPDPSALQKPSTAGGGSVSLTSTVVKAPTLQPAIETGTTSAVPPAASGSSATTTSSVSPSEHSFTPSAVHKRLTAAERNAILKFERAKASFGGFCKDWEQKLAQREHDNLDAIKWKFEGGQEVGQYLGYSKITSCTCKQSTHGQPIGELTYSETNNSLSGKTIDEAKHSTPKSRLATQTTEIFGFGKKGWEY